jgi:hypothetical protein
LLEPYIPVFPALVAAFDLEVIQLDVSLDIQLYHLHGYSIQTTGGNDLYAPARRFSDIWKGGDGLSITKVNLRTETSCKPVECGV